MAIVSLSRNGLGNADSLSTKKNLIAASLLIVMSATASAVAGVLQVVPTLRWFVDGAEPSPAQQRAALRIAHRQNAVHFATGRQAEAFSRWSTSMPAASWPMSSGPPCCSVA
jgi:hypothetical protein